LAIAFNAISPEKLKPPRKLSSSCLRTSGKSNLKAQQHYTRPVNRAAGLICDQIVVLTGYYSHRGFWAPRRRVRFKVPQTHKTLTLLTNSFTSPHRRALPLSLAG